LYKIHFKSISITCKANNYYYCITCH